MPEFHFTRIYALDDIFDIDGIKNIIGLIKQVLCMLLYFSHVFRDS